MTFLPRRTERTKYLQRRSSRINVLGFKEAQSFNENRIAELQGLLKNAVTIEASNKEDIVGIGSTVEVKSDNGTEMFRIVGSAEAKPQEGKISNESPLGRAFLGRKIGEEIEINTPGGINKYKIIKIEK